MVNHHDDSRRAVFDIAIVSMLFLQLLVVGLIGWRLTESQQTAQADQTTEKLVAIESQLNLNNIRRETTLREQAYSEILDTLVSQETGQKGFVDKYADIAQANRLLNENLEGQLSRVRQAHYEKDQLSGQLKTEQLRSSKLASNWEQTKRDLAANEKKLDELQAEINPDGETAKPALLAPWMIYTLSGVGGLLLGGIGGYFLKGLLVDQEDAELEAAQFSSAAEEKLDNQAKPSELSFDESSSSTQEEATTNS